MLLICLYFSQKKITCCSKLVEVQLIPPLFNPILKQVQIWLSISLMVLDKKYDQIYNCEKYSTLLLVLLNHIFHIFLSDWGLFHLFQGNIIGSWEFPRDNL